MIGTRSVRLRVTIACLAILIWLTSNSGFSEGVLGLPQLLAEARALLHEKGIDVLGGEAPVEGFKRPTLALLSSYVQQAKSSGTNNSKAWMEAFRKGAAGMLQVSLVKKASSASMLAWDSAVISDKAVFISYAAEDAGIAETVKAVMRSLGYEAFTFMNKAGARPTYPPGFAGKCFGEATYRVVLDTPNARRSAGVPFATLLGSLIDAMKVVEEFKSRSPDERALEDARIRARELGQVGRGNDVRPPGEGFDFGRPGAR